MTPPRPDLPRKIITGRSGRRGFELDPAVLNDRSDIISFLRTRRSTEPGAITAPGPDRGDIETMLEIAARVPDHGKMEPWRFIVLEGKGKERFAELAARRWQEIAPDIPPSDKRAQIDLIRRIPLLIVVVGRTQPHPKIPEWEQTMSVGAACMNLLIAAQAMGHAAQWRSGWLAEDAEIHKALSVRTDEGEFIAGLFFIGSRDPAAPPAEDRRRPFWQDLATWWTGPENDA
jgi:nitroreductase